jgi:hypothetical protein
MDLDFRWFMKHLMAFGRSWRDNDIEILRTALVIPDLGSWDV